jgi:hypothetical protein
MLILDFGFWIRKASLYKKSDNSSVDRKISNGFYRSVRWISKDFCTIETLALSPNPSPKLGRGELEPQDLAG